MFFDKSADLCEKYVTFKNIGNIPFSTDYGEISAQHPAQQCTSMQRGIIFLFCKSRKILCLKQHRNKYGGGGTTGRAREPVPPPLSGRGPLDRPRAAHGHPALGDPPWAGDP